MKEYRGLWRAQVTNNDDSGEDDAYYGRVRVRVPEIHGMDIPKDDLPWAYPVVPFGQGRANGFDYASLNIPKIDSWVWVLFEHGDVNRPVYIGGWIGGKPSELPEIFQEDSRSGAKYPDIKGLTYGFNGGSFTLRIVDDKRLEIYFDENNIIEIDSQGDSPNEEPQICIRTEWLARIKSDEKIKLEAPEIEITADSKVTVEGAETNVGGTGVTNFKGAVLNGQGRVAGTLEHPAR